MLIEPLVDAVQGSVIQQAPQRGPAALVIVEGLQLGGKRVHPVDQRAAQQAVERAPVMLTGLAKDGGRDEIRVQLFTCGGYGFSGAFDFRRDEDVHGAILVQHSHLIGRKQLLRHQRRGNFHAVLPEGHVLRLQRVLRILKGLAQAQHALDLNGIVRQKLAIGRQVIAGNRDNRLQLGQLHALLLAIPADDGFGCDRAGVLGEFVPAGLRAGHVQIRGDFQHLVRNGLGEHTLQAGQQVLSVAEKGLNGCNLIHCAGKVQLREQALHLGLRHAAVQQGLHLHQQRDVFRHRALVHGGGDLVQILQNTGLFAFVGGAVFPQLLRQRVDVRRRALNVLLLPHGHDDGGQRLGVLLGRGQTVAVVFCVQLI